MHGLRSRSWRGRCTVRSRHPGDPGSRRPSSDRPCGASGPEPGDHLGHRTGSERSSLDPNGAGGRICARRRREPRAPMARRRGRSASRSRARRARRSHRRAPHAMWMGGRHRGHLLALRRARVLRRPRDAPCLWRRARGRGQDASRVAGGDATEARREGATGARRGRGPVRHATAGGRPDARAAGRRCLAPCARDPRCRPSSRLSRSRRCRPRMARRTSRARGKPHPDPDAGGGPQTGHGSPHITPETGRGIRTACDVGCRARGWAGRSPEPTPR